jgi:D-alanyl-lipoteichoic acid acyltransferase DltB (MBOAT superfamily)
VDYALGQKIYKEDNQQKRKELLLISLLVNLDFLGFFKYFNFFVDSFVAAFSIFGESPQFTTLNDKLNMKKYPTKLSYQKINNSS